MAGCFGNHPFDRAMERELYNWLEEKERIVCEYCGHEVHIDSVELDDETEKWTCPECEKPQYI